MDLVDLANWAYGEDISKSIFSAAGRAARVARLDARDQIQAELHAAKVNPINPKMKSKALRRSPQKFRDEKWKDAQSSFPRTYRDGAWGQAPTRQFGQ